MTTRLIDSKNGAITGASSVILDDVDELRDQVKELAGIITRKLSKKPAAGDAKVFDTFDEDEFNTSRWEFDFAEEVEADKDNTELSQEDGVLRITGKYRKEDENRYAWITPNVDKSYQAIEVKVRIRELDGGMSACPGLNWNDDRSETGICLYVKEGFGDVTIYMYEDEEETEEEFDFDIQLNQWYVMRLEYQDAQFHYYWNDHLIKSITPENPVDTLSGNLGLSLDDTKAMTIEVDEIILR